MKRFTTMMKHVSAVSKKLALGAAAAIALTTIGIAGTGAINKAYAADTSPNAIIKGGAANCADLIKDVKASPELQKIYASPDFGLYPQDYDNFAKNCKAGIATSSNKVIVNGKTYATNVGSIGRLKSYQGSDPRTFHIAGAGQDYYYGNLDSKAFANGTSSIPVDVLFNAAGELQFAVMTTTCGNPVYFQHSTPTYSCNELQEKQTGTNTYEFTTNASAGHGAVIDHVVYNIGGELVSRDNPSSVVTKTFTKDTKVTVTVYVKLPNGTVVKVGGGGDCAKQIKYVAPKPVVACTLLTIDKGTVNPSNGDTTHILTATATAKNATIKSYTFTYGDGLVKTYTSSASHYSSPAHVYAANSKDYTAKVLVTFVGDDGSLQTDGNAKPCAVSVPVKPVTTNLVCSNLTANKGTVDQTTGNTSYNFTAAATPSHATITSYVFNFGNGKTQTITTGKDTVTSDSQVYPAGKTYSVSVAVNGTDVYGKKFTNVTSANCKTSFTVAVPVCKPGIPVGSPQCYPSSLACVSLTATAGAIDATGKQTYSFTVSATADNAKITNYAFNFGDGTNQSTTNTTVSHQYAPNANAYTASVVVSGTDAAGKPITAAASANCAKTFTVKVPECKPGIPVGSPQCSTLACTNLSVVPGTVNNDGTQTFTLNATATADQATITNYVFHFGDGSQDISVPSTTEMASTTHNYNVSSPSYIASVTVYGKDVNGTVIQDTNAITCQKPVTPQQPQPKSPGISIVKTVDNQKNEVVTAGKPFEYELVITNTGQIDLSQVVVTDTPQAGITLNSADLGTVASDGTSWTYTIPSLAVGASITVHLSAIVASTAGASYLNTACVNAPEINPTQPAANDSCDTATVTVTPPATPVTPTPPAPTVLPNTGAGSVIGIFGAAVVIATIAHRIFLSRRLARNQ